MTTNMSNRLFGDKPHRVPFSFWIAELDSRHFHFEAYGDTEDRALQALKSGLEDHGRQYGCELRWWSELETDILTREVTIGEAYRDREVIPQL